MEEAESNDRSGKVPLRTQLSLVLGVVVVVFGAAVSQRISEASRIRQSEMARFRALLPDAGDESPLALEAAKRLERIAADYWKWVEDLEYENDGFEAPRIVFDMQVLLMPNEAAFVQKRLGRAIDAELPLGDADFEAHVAAAWRAVAFLEEAGAFDLLDTLSRTNTVLYADPANARDFFVGKSSSWIGGTSLLRVLVWASAARQYEAATAGDWAEFWEHDTRARFASQLVVEHWPCLITVLLHNSCRSAHNGMLMRLIAERSLEREVCEKLFQLDDESLIALTTRGVRGEEALISLYFTEAAILRDEGSEFLAIIMNPLRDVPAWKSIVEQTEELILRESWREADQQDLLELRELEQSAEGFLQIAVPIMSRFVVSARRSVGERGALRSALAIEMYRMDHGVFPTTLGDLIPEYLSEMPIDPFAESSMVYALSEDGEAFSLYSIGLDGVDDGGFHSSDALSRVDPVFDYRLFPPPGDNALP